jgi:glycosyltransferase involved in cell wall biosynthesis
MVREIMPSPPLISFVVPAYNEENLIGATLSALHSAARGAGFTYEVIVVDDGSTDRTASIAREHGARVVAVAARQIAAARNAGARIAAAEWLIFVDADTIVSAELLRATAGAMRDGAVGGGTVVRLEGRIPLYLRPAAVIVPWMLYALRLAAGCFIFCTRQAFDAVGGFDETLYAAEEIALSRALKGRGRFVVLRLPVVTSGRKLRSHSVAELFGLFTAALRGGRASLQTRRHLGLWYGARRDDPK